MEETGSVNMVSRVSSVLGELGKKMNGEDENREAVNIEVISVGPIFNEIDHMRLFQDTKRAPFFRHVPI